MGFYQLWHLGRLCRKHKMLAKCCKTLLRVLYQCDVPFNSNIDEGVYFCHDAFGVVINPNARIRSGTVIQHSVTIGEKNGCHKAPRIEKNVFIGARAMVLGDIVVGTNAIIGAGAVVVKDVPPNSTVVGIPAHVVKRRSKP